MRVSESACACGRLRAPAASMPTTAAERCCWLAVPTVPLGSIPLMMCSTSALLTVSTQYRSCVVHVLSLPTLRRMVCDALTSGELYARVGQPLLRSALDGYNATLLTYGQTGAGKTHTVMGQGDGQDPGVVMRLVAELFDVASQQGKRIQFSMLEIYNEQIRDLFSVRRKSLRIREDPRTGPFVEELSWFVADDLNAMQQVIMLCYHLYP